MVAHAVAAAITKAIANKVLIFFILRFLMSQPAKLRLARAMMLASMAEREQFRGVTPQSYGKNSSPPNDEPEFLFAFRLFFDYRFQLINVIVKLPIRGCSEHNRPQSHTRLESLDKGRL